MFSKPKFMHSPKPINLILVKEKYQAKILKADFPIGLNVGWLVGQNLLRWQEHLLYNKSDDILFLTMLFQISHYSPNINSI